MNAENSPDTTTRRRENPAVFFGSEQDEERARLLERIDTLEARNGNWLKRISEAAQCCADAESRYQTDPDMFSEDWVTLSHAARVMEELERDVRSDLI